MDQSHNEWQLPVAGSAIGSASSSNTWQRRAEQAEADVRRLTERLRGKERHISEMSKALLRMVTLHDAVEERQEQEIESLRAMIAGRDTCRCASAGPSEGFDGVTVHLPFITEILSALFDVMHAFWFRYDEDNPPKSSVVVHAIDERLNLKGQPNGEASRSGQTYASAIRPDWIKETDNRHHVRPRS